MLAKNYPKNLAKGPCTLPTSQGPVTFVPLWTKEEIFNTPDHLLCLVCKAAIGSAEELFDGAIAPARKMFKHTASKPYKVSDLREVQMVCYDDGCINDGFDTIESLLRSDSESCVVRLTDPQGLPCPTIKLPAQFIRDACKQSEKTMLNEGYIVTLASSVSSFLLCSYERVRATWGTGHLALITNTKRGKNGWDVLRITDIQHHEPAKGTLCVTTRKGVFTAYCDGQVTELDGQPLPEECAVARLVVLIVPFDELDLPKAPQLRAGAESEAAEDKKIHLGVVENTLGKYGVPDVTPVSGHAVGGVTFSTEIEARREQTVQAFAAFVSKCMSVELSENGPSVYVDTNTVRKLLKEDRDAWIALLRRL